MRPMLPGHERALQANNRSGQPVGTGSRRPTVRGVLTPLSRVPTALLTGLLTGTLAVLLAVLAPLAPGGGVAVPAQAAPSDAAAATERVGPTKLPKGYVRQHRRIGTSVKGRTLHAYYRGGKNPRTVLVVLGQMHGDESAGTQTARWVRDHIRPTPRFGVWVIPTMNPDGDARGTRQNARGVDLNRNWPTSGWERSSGGRYWGGPKPASEPETRAVMGFLRRVKPDFIASIHQPLYAVGAGRTHVAWQRRLARNLDLPRRHLGVGTPSGKVSPTMTGWYNARFGKHGVATTIEYGASPSRHYRTVKAGRGIVRAALIRVLTPGKRGG